MSSQDPVRHINVLEKRTPLRKHLYENPRVSSEYSTGRHSSLNKWERYKKGIKVLVGKSLQGFPHFIKTSSKSIILKPWIMKLEFCLTFQVRQLVKNTKKHYFLKLYFTGYGVLRLCRNQTLQIRVRCSLKFEIKWINSEPLGFIYSIN